jgi:hypothetical protein
MTTNLDSQNNRRKPRNNKWSYIMPDLPGWDSLVAVTRYHQWAEIIGIVVLSLLVIAEVVSYRYGQRKDDLTTKQQEATDQRHDEEMARLHANTEASRAETARALAQAAEANRIAEEERLARVRLEASLASRHLTNDQKSRLTTALAKLQPNMKTLTLGELGDQEANEYATEIILCINNAGIYAHVQNVGTQSPPRYGLKVTEDLKQAFEFAGIKIDEILLPTGRPPTIFVGLKPSTL